MKKSLPQEKKTPSKQGIISADRPVGLLKEMIRLADRDEYETEDHRPDNGKKNPPPVKTGQAVKNGKPTGKTDKKLSGFAQQELVDAWMTKLEAWAKLWMDVFYNIGFYTEYFFVKVFRTTRTLVCVAGHKLADALLFLGKGLIWIPKAVLLMLWQVVHHTWRAIRNVYEIWMCRDPDKPRETWRETFSYIFRGFARNIHFIYDIGLWALPVLAAMAFAFTVRTVMNYQYVLKLSCDGKAIGYVANDSVFDIARQEVENRIVYVDGEDHTDWKLEPSFTLAVNDNFELLDVEDVTDAILRSSGQEIVEATGFYLNDVFYGAVTDSDRLEKDLEQLKAPYRTGEEGEYVSFMVEPELREGVYLRSSIVNYSVLDELIHSEVAGEVTYTVVKGDTPSGIANQHGLTTAELINMNPNQDIMNNLHPGDVLVISQAVPFLQVQVTYRRTEIEDIPFDVNKTTTADLNFGVVKVKSAGVNGSKECVYDYLYVDGVLQSKTLVESTVLTEPITQEVLVGTRVRAGVTMIPSSGPYMWPVPSYGGVSRGFTGLYAHNGMDIWGSSGIPIVAAQSGVVTVARYTSSGYGVYVVVDHGGGYSTLYGHCSSLAVSVGDTVSQGQTIAYLGSTGYSTGPHCHFEVRINGTQVDPAAYIGYG